MLTKTLLTGLYENRVPEDFENYLWKDLCIHFPKKVHHVNEGNQVFLQYTEDDKVIAELYQFGRLIDTMTLPGKSKDYYFTIRKGSHFFTILLFTSKVSKKSIIGNDANGDLLLAQGWSSNTMFLESDTGEDEETVVATYMRISDDRPAQTSFSGL